MATLTSIAELRNMQLADLVREVMSQEMLVAQLRLCIKMKKEKDTAKYRREKKQLACMKTVLTEKKKAESLSAEEKKRTVPSSAKATEDKLASKKS